MFSRTCVTSTEWCLDNMFTAAFSLQTFSFLPTPKPGPCRTKKTSDQSNPVPAAVRPNVDRLRQALSTIRDHGTTAELEQALAEELNQSSESSRPLQARYSSTSEDLRST